MRNLTCDGVAVDVAASAFPSSKLWINNNAYSGTEQAGFEPFLASGQSYLNGVGHGYLTPDCLEAGSYRSGDPTYGLDLYDPNASLEGRDRLRMLLAGRTGGPDGNGL
jgi:hypothetical protein